MQRTSRFARPTLIFALLTLFSVFPAASIAQDDSARPGAPGPNSIFVKSKFGGQIFGFDIDQNGTEGLLAESKPLTNGNYLAAVETFDQTTGKILNVVSQTQSQDDFLALGVFGTSVGLFEHEHEISFLNIQRTFSVMNPLSGNKITGRWTPPIGKTHLLSELSRTQGATNTAVFAQDNSGNFIPWVFSSNVAANTFGPIVKITDSFNFGSGVPPIAYDTQTNQAILGGGNGCFGCAPVFAMVDLSKASFTEFTGVGFGFVNGMAVDSADNVMVTTTEDDASVEFYDLTTESGFVEFLPNSGGQQFFSGADVEFDALHKLFLVAQPNSSSAASGSTIYVYDINGNLQATLNGFSFSNGFNVVAAHIALKPSTRTGFVDGPTVNVNQLQGFSY